MLPPAPRVQQHGLRVPAQQQQLWKQQLWTEFCPQQLLVGSDTWVWHGQPPGLFSEFIPVALESSLGEGSASVLSQALELC